MTIADATVVVMIHNGAQVLAPTLEALCRQTTHRTLKIIAACNGCRDESVRCAENFVPRFDGNRHSYVVVDLKEGGRARSLNSLRHSFEGDLICVDQDAVLSPNAVDAMLDAFAAGADMAVPALRLRLPRSPAVRLHYQFWTAIPYVKNSPSTIGVYALSARVLATIARWPEIHSDDKFSRLCVLPERRRVVEHAWYEVSAPADIRALIQAQRRYIRGNREITAIAPGLGDVPRHAGLVALLADPRLWVPALVYVGITAVAQFGLPAKAKTPASQPGP